MIFPKPQARAILDGRKTQHRTPTRHKDGQLQPCRYKPGRDYAIQRAGGTTHDDRIQITSVHLATLSDLTYQDVRAEGHKTRAAFADTWMLHHNPHWPPTQPCDRCDGEGTTDCDQCWDETPTGPVRVHELDAHPCPHCDHGQVPADLDDAHVLTVFDQEHADTQVWVLEFQVVDTDTYLADVRAGRGDLTRRRHDAIDDLPTVNPDVLRPHWRNEADRRHADADRDQLRSALRSRNRAA